MRIIAGRFRSRRIKSVPGLQVRPTPDRLREALFSVLQPRIEGATFVDVYAGSGAVAIEALSRGAAHIILIERDPQALGILRENLRMLEAESEASVVRGSAGTVLPQILEARKPEIVFLDPPYDRVAEYTQALGYCAKVAVPYVIAQHSTRLALNEQYEQLRRIRILKQGDNSLSFYQPGTSAGE
jgi:16S rRNA (guanine(966)-N(2))-methyltransferase RsmD